jgi:hypothetical protein
MPTENQLFKAKIVLAIEGEEDKAFSEDILAIGVEEAIKKAADIAIEKAKGIDYDFNRIDFQIQPDENRLSATDVIRPRQH